MELQEQVCSPRPDTVSISEQPGAEAAGQAGSSCTLTMPAAAPC
jgi:hypothetical protein